MQKQKSITTVLRESKKLPLVVAWALVYWPEDGSLTL